MCQAIFASDIGKDIDRIFSYDYETEVQFLNILRAYGYKPQKSIRDVRAYRQRNGIFAFSITFNDGYTTLGIPMDQDDSDRYRRLDPDDRLGFLMQLAVDHLTNQSAQDIVGRIDRQLSRRPVSVLSLSVRRIIHRRLSQLYHIFFLSISLVSMSAPDTDRNVNGRLGTNPPMMILTPKCQEQESH
ncbi:MAG: hypothetical protein K2K45_01295 [Muribaculaceae bacterium]|nr:hypothetical protein [Muribaculaceae bacterium]